MKKLFPILFAFGVFAIAYSCGDLSTAPDFDGHIGQVEREYQIPADIADVVGLAVQENSEGMFLLIFEGSSGKIHRFGIDRKTRDLDFLETFFIDGANLQNPRGLAYAREASGDVLYFLDFEQTAENSGPVGIGKLYRYGIDQQDLTSVDLSNPAYEIRNMEVLGLTKQGENILLSYDPSGYDNHTSRTRRGLVSIFLGNETVLTTSDNDKQAKRPYGWIEALSGRPIINKHLPGPGKPLSDGLVEPSRSLTSMTKDGYEYLWGTIGNDHIYLLDGPSGRGLFFFDMPGSLGYPVHDVLAYGAGNLWVAERTPGGHLVHRVNVHQNLDQPYAGPKRFRELRLQITSTVNEEAASPQGDVYHTFCHPYSDDLFGNQGVLSNSIRVNDLTDISDYTVEHLYFDPAEDPGSRQHYTLVTYRTEDNPTLTQYQTEFFVKLWTREYKHFVYPHLIKGIDSGPRGTKYLEDDEILYRIEADPEAYKGFIERVSAYISAQYDMDADMNNPYWVARNILEYVMDNYHYPIDQAGFWATYDFEKGDFNSHPGNLKAAYSGDGSFVNNIIACSGTGTMVGGALRSAGIPSIWVGTSQEGSQFEGFLERDDETNVGNGHRYNHVWLGEFYGWQRFDATPRTPVDNAFHLKPLEVPQWLFMLRAAGGVEPRRMIHNLQSEYWDKLHVPFRSTCKHNVNMCGALRYNLLGTFSEPEHFNLSRYVLRNRAIQFVDNIIVEVDSHRNAVVSWDLGGEWDLDPDARLVVVLDRKCLSDEKNCLSGYTGSKVIAKTLPTDQRYYTLNLADYEKGEYRVTISKKGDLATGNATSFVLL